MREPAQGVAAVIDSIDRLNSMQQAAYEKCQERLRWCCEACGQPPTCG
jgi:rubrerythrin